MAMCSSRSATQLLTQTLSSTLVRLTPPFPIWLWLEPQWLTQHMVVCASTPAGVLVPSGEECYCAMDKGAINEGHVLLLPIEHYASSLACSANAWAEMQRYLSAFKACAASQVISPCPDANPPPLPFLASPLPTPKVHILTLKALPTFWLEALHVCLFCVGRAVSLFASHSACEPHQWPCVCVKHICAMYIQLQYIIMFVGHYLRRL